MQFQTTRGKKRRERKERKERKERRAFILRLPQEQGEKRACGVHPTHTERCLT
jgi:hypothetical protein